MAVNNRTCFACGTKFRFCPSCNGPDRLKEAWHSEFCSEACKDIWTTATKFNLGKITKPEAKSIISALNLKPIKEYVACVQRDLDVILKEEPKPKRSKKIEAPVIEEPIIEEISMPVDVEVQETVEDNIVVDADPYISEITYEVVNETIENE